MSNETGTTTCVCGVKIYFRDEVRSSYECNSKRHWNVKPLEAGTGLVHECALRGWSIWVKCNSCRDAIRFNNDVRLDNGKKIPYGKNGKVHQCMVVVKQ